MLRGRLPLMILTLALAARPVLAQGQQAPIAWRTDLMSGRQEAIRTGRNMLVHFWATWCGPCQRLESTVFKQPAVASTLQQKFIPVKLNADDFPQIARAYGVEVLPTDVILAPDGTVLSRFASPQNPSAYLAQLSPFGSGSRPTDGVVAGTGDRRAQQAQYAPTVPIAGGRNVPSAYAGVQPSGQPNLAGHTGVNPGGVSYAEIDAGRRGQSAPDRENAAQGANVGSPAGAMAPAASSSLLSGGSSGAPHHPTNYGGIGARYTNAGASPATGQSASGGNGVTGRTGGQVLSGHRGPAGYYGSPNAGGGPTHASGATGLNPPQPGNAAASRESIPPSGQVVGGANPSAAPPSGPPNRPPLGMDGFCPVTLKREQRWVPGDPRYGIVHRGCLYFFAGPSQAQQFWSDPDSFSPVLSGVDPVLALDNGATVKGQREHGVEYNGLFYLFSSESTLQHFYRNPERYAAGVRQAMQGTRSTTLR